MKRFTYKAANMLYEVKAFDSGWTHYFRDGYSHRENGPASIYGGNKYSPYVYYYYLSGAPLSKEEHARRSKK